MSSTPTLYCAPCTSDLALVREAVTFVSGTASCAAHAVLLTHPHDNPGRRRARLNQLRQLAESKAATAPPEEQAALELLVHEYTLAGAMDMGGQPRPDGSPRRERGPAQPGDRAPGGQPGQPGEPGEGRGKRGRRGRDRDRPRGDREPGALPDGDAGSDSGSDSAGPADASAPAVTAAESAAPTAPASDAPTSAPAESAPAPSSDSAPASAPEPSAPAQSAAPAPSAPADTAPSTPPAPPSMPEIVPAGTSPDGAPAPTSDGSPA